MAEIALLGVGGCTIGMHGVLATQGPRTITFGVEGTVAVVAKKQGTPGICGVVENAECGVNSDTGGVGEVWPTSIKHFVNEGERRRLAREGVGT